MVNTLIIMLMMLATNQAPSLVTAANIATYLNNTAMTRTAGGTSTSDGGVANVNETLSDAAKESPLFTVEELYSPFAVVKTYFRETKRLDFTFSCRHQK
jgi:hypothetical protein